jgi:hypothetical protein
VTDRVVYFNGFATASKKQLSGGELDSFWRQLETAVVQGRCGGKGLRRRVINFGAVQFAAPITIV